MLKLGQAWSRYYAGGVIRSQIFLIQQRSEANRYINVIAFVYFNWFCLKLTGFI